MEGFIEEALTAKQLGEVWIQAIVERDFGRLARLCHPDVSSSLLIPTRMIQLETANDLQKKIESWFSEYDSIESLHTNVEMIGERLGISYRLRCTVSGTSEAVHQHVFGKISDGRIQRLWLLCSDFHPESVTEESSDFNDMKAPSDSTSVPVEAVIRAQALLEFKADANQASTCALLTPYIKQKLGQLSSGQVLEVRVDDAAVKDDIESWCRLTGNKLLKIDQMDDHELVFYISKK